MSRRFALRSRNVLTPSGLREGAVVVEDDRIAAIVDAPPAGIEVIDYGDLVIMPGLVDCHVHINEPGRTHWEGFVTATRAAAAGGVTTLVDMPLNCSPVTTTTAAFAAKLEACKGELTVDVGFWGGVIPGNEPELEGLARAGVLGCKAFMIDSGIDEFPCVDEHDLELAMPRLRALGLPLLAHAELDLGASVEETDPRKYRGYLQSRPKAWEDAAIAMLIALSRRTGCSVHVVHLSSAESIPQLRQARGEGVPITVETCAHYLCLCAEEIPDGDTRYKCAPPIREEQNRDRLWQGLAAGVLDCVVTDHSPCVPELKSLEAGDFHAAWGGIASLQLGLHSVWSQAMARGYDLATLARWMCEAPAKIAGVSDRKGSLAPGRDADIVVWDPHVTTVVDAGQLHMRNKLSPYAGMPLRGQVHATWVRGTKVYEQGEFLVEPAGRPLLHRSATP